MYHYNIALLLLLAKTACLALAQFTNPSETGRSVWRIGETQTVSVILAKPWQEFNIALWQEIGGRANIGPIIYQTTAGIDPDVSDTEFNFTVRIDNLKLINSNKFFLWLKAGDVSQQGNISAPGMSSSYFNITDEPAPASITPSTTLPSTTASSTSTPTASAPTNESQASGPVSTVAPTSVTQGGILISTGALAGIGAAAGFCVLALLIGVVYCIFRRKWKQRELKLQQQRQRDWPQSHSSLPTGTSTLRPELDDPYSRGLKAMPRAPAEMGTNYSPVEMFAGDQSQWKSR